MKRAVFTILALMGAISPTLAGDSKYFVEMDTVGNCSIVDAKPSGTAGMKILGDQGGYASKDDATAALKALPEGKCKGIVG